MVLLCDELPAGRGPGRPSKALTIAQAEALLAAAESSPMRAYIMVPLLTGARAERCDRWRGITDWMRWPAAAWAGHLVVATGGRDNTAQVWDLTTSAAVAVLDFRRIRALAVGAGWDLVSRLARTSSCSTAMRDTDPLWISLAEPLANQAS
ncbi:hypothetical protein [Amycolatopsis sp. NPDC004625]|uniref:hypothetical protein n=1 Tax=Amycolatopsis sp. NPDC004625 TaxID=3154670 RepID=UPI0033AE87F9